MKYLITLIKFIHIVHFSEGLSEDRSWINYGTTNLRKWNNEVAVNGLYFSVDMANPMAFYSHYENICQLIIPMNSEINDTNFSWTSTDSIPRRQVSCPEQESGNTWWVDPRNWDSVRQSNATPHLERLPCSYESVGIKPSDNLRVLLPKNPVKVRRFYWDQNRPLYPSTFKDETFIKNFVVTGEKDLWEMIEITGKDCRLNQTGCECGTLIHYKETCKILRNECSTSLPCENAIMPTGHCCNICGCTVSVDFNPSTFAYAKLENFVRKYFRDLDTVNYYMSRQSGDVVQIVIINAEPKDNYDDIQRAAFKLARVLLSDEDSMSLLSPSILNAQPSCCYERNSYGSLAAISGVMIPIFAIASLIILIVLLFQSKILSSEILDKFKSSFTFVKFENQSEKDREQLQDQKQLDPVSAKHAEASEIIEPELHSEGKSENGTSSEIDDDSVLVEVS